MTQYVIDATTLIHLVAEGFQASPRHQIVAPNLIRSQALSLLLGAVRNGDLTEKLALQHHERLTELKMRLLGDRVSRRTAWKIAREQDWSTTYDAEYLAVTKLQADALITVNRALTAKAKDLVPLAQLEALAEDQHKPHVRTRNRRCAWEGDWPHEAALDRLRRRERARPGRAARPAEAYRRISLA